MEGYAKHCNMRSFEDAMKNRRFVEGMKNYLKGSLVVASYGTKVTYRYDSVLSLRIIYYAQAGGVR